MDIVTYPCLLAIGLMAGKFLEMKLASMGFLLTQGDFGSQVWEILRPYEGFWGGWGEILFLELFV